MAKNWTIAEAIEAIKNHELSKIQDVGKRFPLTANLLSQGIESDAFTTFGGIIPEYVTVRKIESILAEDVEKFEDDDEDKPKKEKDDKKKDKPADEKKSAPKAKDEDDDEDKDEKLPIEECTKKADAMQYSGKELWAYLGEHGVPGKERGHGKEGQAEAVAKLNRKLQKQAEKAGKVKDEEPEDEPTNEEKLKDKTVKELYEIAKDMGLEPEPKKGKKYYLELIEAGPGVDDEWEDDEPEEKPKKEKGKSEGKATKKKEEPEDEDDDEWEI